MYAAKLTLLVSLVSCVINSASAKVVYVFEQNGNWTSPYNSTHGSYEIVGETSTDKTYGRVFLTDDESDDEELEIPDPHPCLRKCEGDQMTCQYVFRVEYYQTLSKACYDCPANEEHCILEDCIPADGVKRPIIVVNRKLPGPAVEVCQGDTIEVIVYNRLFDETTSIHWHGQHQRTSQFMDGVPFVTQCPIGPQAVFVYKFEAAVPGTHFWHSHSAFQRGDGVFGPLIVRQPESEDKYSDLYDFDLSEHVISVIDWTHRLSVTKYLGHYHSNQDNKPLDILVNGKGRFVAPEGARKEILNTPVERFNVTQGSRYRFRLINAGFLNCPIEVSVDDHSLLIISSDGGDLEPVEAQSFVCYAGERFDFIINMNQSVDNYWMRFRGLMDCDERFKSVFQGAVLHYEGAPENTFPEKEASYGVVPQGLRVNAMNTGVKTENALIMSELRAHNDTPVDPALQEEADFKFFISYDFYPKDNKYYHKAKLYGFYDTDPSQRTYTPQLNYISMKTPPIPLLSNLDMLGDLKFCNSETIPKSCDIDFCECIHLLSVPLDSVVELILIDKGVTYDANHPFHLHGYNFRVVGMDRLGSSVTEEEIRALDDSGDLKRNLVDPPIKDTVTVPDGGYTILRWHATNPGFWLFHCHIEFHVATGMALIIKVGEDGEMPTPPDDFPQCQNYAPGNAKMRGIFPFLKDPTEQPDSSISITPSLHLLCSLIAVTLIASH